LGIFQPADILLPNACDMTKWSVVACDQFSSEPEYWERVKREVGGAPSSLAMILPEAYLGRGADESGETAARAMADYLRRGIFEKIENSFIYVERALSDGKTRRGLVGAVDLEAYDYSPDTAAPIRASERTVAERLPARAAVRRRAALELPHTMALIDDAARSVIEPFARETDAMQRLYDFELMEGGGHIRGWRVTGRGAARVTAAFERLRASPRVVIGDGNHSLAAAKSHWDSIKSGSGGGAAAHPARYALVELNNVYDPAVTFEAIHRVVFDVDARQFIAGLEKAVGGGGAYKIRWRAAGETGEISARAACIGDLIEAVQTYIDGTGVRADYIHGADSAIALSGAPGAAAVLLPAMDKSDIFGTVAARGLFPRKSFSIGEARDKRYYLECRRIAAQ
jgi:hypothetical protein